MYRDTDVPILLPADHIRVQLDDHLMQVQSIAASRFVAYFQTQVAYWQSSLAQVEPEPTDILFMGMIIS